MTQPQGFTFRSDARLRGTAHLHAQAQAASAASSQPPSMEEREQRGPGQGQGHVGGGGGGHKPMQLTEPRPFQLATERRGQVHQVCGLRWAVLFRVCLFVGSIGSMYCV